MVGVKNDSIMPTKISTNLMNYHTIISEWTYTEVLYSSIIQSPKNTFAK
jgi:ABC-type spermidine/putrescine transport system permease subunit I